MTACPPPRPVSAQPSFYGLIVWVPHGIFSAPQLASPTNPPALGFPGSHDSPPRKAMGFSKWVS